MNNTNTKTCSISLNCWGNTNHIKKVQPSHWERQMHVLVSIKVYGTLAGVNVKQHHPCIISHKSIKIK